MKTTLHKWILLALLILVTTPLYAYTKKEITAYFQYLQKIQALPINAIPIKPSDATEVKSVVDLLRRNNLYKLGRLSYSDDGQISDEYGENIVVYKGNFSNDNAVEYLFLITNGGSLSTDTVFGVYKMQDDHLVEIDFNSVVIKNFFPGGDMAQFYMWVAKPFVYVKNNKTYMRFMSYPAEHTDYDKSKLLVCTYLWEGARFRLESGAKCISNHNPSF